MARLYKKDIAGKPINFNRDAPKVNLRRTPEINPGNLVATISKLVAALGKIGTATGTIETVKGKNHFWIQIEPSVEVKAYFALTFNFKAPKLVWVRSDVVHWQKAKTIVKRGTEKVIEPVKEVAETVTEAAGDVVGTFVSKLAPWIVTGGVIYILTKKQRKPQST